MPGEGCRHCIKLVAIAVILVTCLFSTLYYTGYFDRNYSPSSLYTFMSQEKSRPNIEKKIGPGLPSLFRPKVQEESRPNIKETKKPGIQETSKPEISVPVIPVLRSDLTEKLPTYENVSDDVYKTDWWLSAAYLEWDLDKRKKDYKCEDIKDVGNWWICEDKLFKTKKPCLVYSFGIAYDFSFDDAMAQHGCEVHSFDPSMNVRDHKRNKTVNFHAIGLGGRTIEKFHPRKDMYVKDNRTWTIMTLSLIKTALGHKYRDIDVLKIDVEGHEWEVIENLFEDNMFSQVKQFMLEYHLFPDWPAKSEYPKLLRTYKKLHDIGYQKFVTSMHPSTHIPEKFNIQADVAYVNTKYKKPKRTYNKFKLAKSKT